MPQWRIGRRGEPASASAPSSGRLVIFANQ